MLRLHLVTDIAYALEVALHKSALVTALNSSLFMQFLSVFEKVIARPVANITEIDYRVCYIRLACVTF